MPGCASDDAVRGTLLARRGARDVGIARAHRRVPRWPGRIMHGAHAVIAPRLLVIPLAGITQIAVADANRLLIAWGHRLGECNRPFRTEAFALEVDGEPVSIALSASTVSDTVDVYRRGEVVELARLCSAPTARWATRVMIRLWREVAAPRWMSWPVVAAISYQQNAHYRGDIYRFDGWTKVRSDVGKSTGGGAWSRKRYAGDAVLGSKSLWVWRYVDSPAPAAPPDIREGPNLDNGRRHAS